MILKKTFTKTILLLALFQFQTTTASSSDNSPEPKQLLYTPRPGALFIPQVISFAKNSPIITHSTCLHDYSHSKSPIEIYKTGSRSDTPLTEINEPPLFSLDPYEYSNDLECNSKTVSICSNDSEYSADFSINSDDEELPSTTTNSPVNTSIQPLQPSIRLHPTTQKILTQITHIKPDIIETLTLLQELKLSKNETVKNIDAIADGWVGEQAKTIMHTKYKTEKTVRLLRLACNVINTTGRRMYIENLKKALGFQ